MFSSVINLFSVTFLSVSGTIYVSRLTVVSREAKEEVPCEGLSTNAREYFTRTNLVKIKNYKPLGLALNNSR